MLDNNQIEELKTNGFIRIPNFIDEIEIDSMLSTMSSFKENHYNEDNLINRVAYLADESETRLSNAFMVSTGTPKLPHISIENNTVLGNLIDDYQMILMQLSPLKEVSRDTRLMFNMQEYKEKSKPIPWHLDGEYLDVNDIENDGQIILKEGVIAQYVGVYTLFNDNELATNVKNIVTDEVLELESEAGDLLLFDNTTFLHSVPELEKNRAMFGFRNFDYLPYHYGQEYFPGALPVSNQCFTGYARRISSEFSELLQQDFIENKWKENFTSDLKAKF